MKILVGVVPDASGSDAMALAGVLSRSLGGDVLIAHVYAAPSAQSGKRKVDAEWVAYLRADAEAVVADAAGAAPRYGLTQFETAVRSTASRYPYDHINGEADETPSLRCNRGAIAAALAEEARQRVALAGVEVLEARISDLAYAPEIAQAMLKRQQAQAIIAARQLIVDGAVGMVEQALARIDNGKMVKLSDEQKASMVNNLLVVLTSDNEATPVVSTG